MGPTSDIPAFIYIYIYIRHYAGRLLRQPEKAVNPVHLKKNKKTKHIQNNNGFYVALFLQIGCYCAVVNNSVL